MSFIPKCRHPEFGAFCGNAEEMGYSSKGFILPCCFMEIYDNTPVEDELRLNIFSPHLNLENDISIDEILNSREWKEFNKSLDSYDTAPKICQDVCSRGAPKVILGEERAPYMKNLILGYPRGSNKWQGLADALEQCDQDAEIVVDKFDEIEGPYGRIWTMAESLLPLQAKLEQEWNINNVSIKAAEILSDKKRMDDFCIEEGLESLIPKSVIPTSLKDFKIFKGGPFIIKPVVGSGTKQDLDHRIHYMTYHNVDSFVKDTYSELLFQVNKTGFVDEEFGGRINYYMAQEYLPHKKLYAPYVYVNERGSITKIFWVVGNIETHNIDQNRFESKPVDFMSIDYMDAPKDVISACEFYFETIVSELGIKSMFFAGPDFYYEDGLPIKVIDCNPRIGQGLQILNELNDNKILSSLLQVRSPGQVVDYNIQTHLLWKNAQLKPGKIKAIKDYSHLKKFITSTSLDGLHPGDIIEEFANTPAAVMPKVSLKIPGNTQTDMLETFRSVSEQIQSCIVYED